VPTEKRFVMVVVSDRCWLEEEEEEVVVVVVVCVCVRVCV
jgi:hypothetical protein